MTYLSKQKQQFQDLVKQSTATAEFQTAWKSFLKDKTPDGAMQVIQTAKGAIAAAEVTRKTIYPKESILHRQYVAEDYLSKNLSSATKPNSDPAKELKPKVTYEQKMDDRGKVTIAKVTHIGKYE